MHPLATSQADSAESWKQNKLPIKLANKSGDLCLSSENSWWFLKSLVIRNLNISSQHRKNAPWQYFGLCDFFPLPGKLNLVL